MNRDDLHRLFLLVLPALLLLTGTGCQSAYYGAMEKLGYYKRDLLVDSVEDAQHAQEEAKQQFQSALQQFTALTGFQGGELQEQYDKLEREYERSAEKAGSVHSRIEAVENVAEALFKEWEEELGEYSSPRLRAASQRQLHQTRAQYDRLIQAMKRAESKMPPVLAALHDQVLFLKHNLNARAIASLKGELASVETDVASLIREMEKSIAETEKFLQAMNRS